LQLVKQLAIRGEDGFIGNIIKKTVKTTTTLKTTTEIKEIKLVRLRLAGNLRIVNGILFKRSRILRLKAHSFIALHMSACNERSPDARS